MYRQNLLFCPFHYLYISLSLLIPLTSFNVSLYAFLILGGIFITDTVVIRNAFVILNGIIPEVLVILSGIVNVTLILSVTILLRWSTFLCLFEV